MTIEEIKRKAARAGPNGETRVRWVRFDGVIVHSDINGHQVDQLDGTATLFPLDEAA
ncbi:hypothetical protein [Cupriavidus sp.]|uniref:hypothetical protein n=1 Tax=Cupriavidus sp. TaxID=1873897 RepID=UPI0025C3BE37|nr:hypothetical protein [Cupriavidus sp.]MCA3185986.1 hypothetical protein [Cupriavidus sp.]MCA3193600.1 hypothetical protein [Cupriavidus sp.]MCA3199990.1 hypothetical protein [Cupriavidus sp.]MCA3202003.1 hypothetical protein [Cupriavidus sp.]MCA3235956.1 hypothetical protein [Cupriavidus sp.]